MKMSYNWRILAGLSDYSLNLNTSCLRNTPSGIFLCFTSLSDCYKLTDKQKFSACVHVHLQIIDMEVSILINSQNQLGVKYVKKKPLELGRIDHNYGKKLAGIPHTLLERNPSSAKHLSMCLTLIKGS